MERLYVVENGRAAAAGDQMHALTPYNRFVAKYTKGGAHSMKQAGAAWRTRSNPSASAAKHRAEQRWRSNPSGEILGIDVPQWVQNLSPFDAKNLTNVAALAGAAVLVIGAPMYAGAWNTGWTGIGLTALAAVAATGGAAMLSPALAVPVGATGLAIVILRGAIHFVPMVAGWIVNPLLRWLGAAPPARSSGAVAGYNNRGLPAGYGRKMLPAPTQVNAAGQPSGPAETFVSGRNSY